MAELLCAAQEHARGCMSLFGIESPGLTSSLSLARAVVQALDAH